MDGCPALELSTERTVFVETGIGKQWGSCEGSSPRHNVVVSSITQGTLARIVYDTYETGARS
jgi:hypothetical protein